MNSTAIPILGAIPEDDFSTLYHGYRQPGSRRTRVFWVGFGTDGGDGLLPAGRWGGTEFDWGSDGAGAMALSRALIDHATGSMVPPLPVDSFYAVEFYRVVMRRVPWEATWECTSRQIQQWLLALGVGFSAAAAGGQA